MSDTTGKKSNYASKKQQMQNGTYHGTSPFYENIPEFQHMKPLSTYTHLREAGMNVGDSSKKGQTATYSEPIKFISSDHF